MPVFAEITARLQAGEKQRFLALTNNGSACLPVCYYWFDLFAKAIWRKYGAKNQFLSTDYYKNTELLLEGFERDGADFKPDAALILIGGTELTGSDNLPMPLETTAANLRKIHQRLHDTGCAAVFMTYYAPDPERVEKARMQHFHACMDLVREAAFETGAGLIDHLSRWELLRNSHPLTYQRLLRDPLHQNDLGNMFMALDMARCFGAAVPPGLSTEIDDALSVQQLADQLEKE
ncbi:MAG: SGNH/GDSL hydrolase family protein [Victivallales bacterium]